MILPPLDYNSGPALRSYLESRGLSIRKQWGQNFLINPNVRKTLIDALTIDDLNIDDLDINDLDMDRNNSVWEIGSGLGAMTFELLERGLHVTAFEIDPGFCSILEEFFTGPNFTLIRGDVLKTWKKTTPAPYLFGNLPYVTAALLMGNLIEGQRLFKRMVITVQKEVALRMTAQPGSKNYSSISVLFASAYSGRILMTLKGPSFYPVPHVDSAAVCFEQLSTTPPPRLFYPLVRSLFASRRKTISNNLQHFFASSGIIRGRDYKAITAEVLEKSGLHGSQRAENLPVEAFFRLAAELDDYQTTN
jgi:16S rRNA (adenine1518-N6/adenine1519-N6)-dimethyltransferase